MATEKLWGWELTPEEMDVALEVGAKAYLAAYEAAYQKHKSGEVVLYPNQFHVKAKAITNAAVRKVVGWLQKHNYSSDCESMDATDLFVGEERWAALKKEVGL